MAITDAGKLFESQSTARVATHTLGQAVKAGSLIVIGLGGVRNGSILNLASISDTRGNAWQWEMFSSSYRAAGIAWCRTQAPMTTGDRITVTWNGTPSYAWKSGHAFEGASANPTDRDTRNGSSSSPSVSLGVSGSDWLTVACMCLPYEYAVSATPLNSSTSQDDNGATSSAPWIELFSRNGTSGSTHTIGGSIGISVPYAIAGVSFPFEAMPAGKAVGALIGV